MPDTIKKVNISLNQEFNKMNNLLKNFPTLDRKIKKSEDDTTQWIEENNEKIEIPSEYSAPSYFTVTEINNINWDRTADLGKVLEEWEEKGSQYKDGIAVIDGRYLIACTATFGKVGDKIDFYLDDGTVIPTIMFDEKSQEVVPWDPAPANKWGHDNGANILEFEVDTNYYQQYGNPGNGHNEWYKEWNGKRVTSAMNLGDNVTSSEINNQL